MTCLTCRARTATWLAHLNGDRWPVCDRCKAQGEHRTRITYTPLAAP